MNSNLPENYYKDYEKNEQDICFANVDLEIKSKEDLQPLINGFGGDVDILFHDWLKDGFNFASLEIHLDKFEPAIYGEPDETIKAFCSVIENLSDDSREIWNNCAEKIFNIGFESGNTEKCFDANIETETIKRIAEIGANIKITIYPVLDYTIKRKEES